MKKLIVFFGLIAVTGFAQDSTSSLSFKTFIALVKKNHPISFQAQIMSDLGDAKLLKAKGAFDPKLNGEASQKYFDSKQYYSHLHAGLKVPTWFGLTAQAGYTNNSGERLNPELYTPPNAGLWYAGLTLNLGNGLFIDARRAELKQAEIYQNSSRIEQNLMLNQLVFDATVAYWDWFKTYNKFIVYETALNNAEIRLDAIKQSANLGDKPFVDTLKAALQVQERALYLEQTKLNLTNKQALVNVFLWEEGFIPLEIDSSTTPHNYTLVSSTTPEMDVILNLDLLVQNHPEMILAKNKIALSKIDYRLKKEALKPVAQLKYNALSSPINDNALASYSVENYNWGAYVSYPIFTRKERGNLRVSALKIEEQEAKFHDKTALINYKIKSTHNTWVSTKKQVDIYEIALNSYRELFRAELTLFNMGESSLFLVNTRDQAMIDAQVKLIEIIYQNQLSEAFFNYQTVNY